MREYKTHTIFCFDFNDNIRFCCNEHKINNPSVSYADSSLYTREPKLHLNLMPRNVELCERSWLSEKEYLPA